MTDIILPFNNVATFDFQRRPNVMMNPEVDTWVLNCKSKVDREFLIGALKDPLLWRVMFKFQSNDDALLFKLTFGGA